MPMLATGLQRHPKSGVYYLRRRIPSDLLICYPGRKEVVFSLKTKDYRLACSRHRNEEARLTVEWNDKRKQQADVMRRQSLPAVKRVDVLNQEAIDSICCHFEAVSLSGDEARRESEAPYSLEEVQGYQAAYAEGSRELKAAVACGDVDSLRPLLTQFLELYGYEISVSDADMRRLALAYGRAAIRTNDKLLRRYEGEDEPTPELPPAFRAPSSPVSASTPVPSGSSPLHLSTVMKEFMSKQDEACSMYARYQTVLAMLLEVVGDVPIQDIRQKMLEDFFDLLLRLPPRWKDEQRKTGKTISELAAMEWSEGIAPKTFKSTYIAAVRPFLKYAQRVYGDQGFPGHLTVSGIVYRGDREEGENQQRAMRQEELKRLFGGPECKAYAADPALHGRYWLPLLGVYSGARVNEVCQLNPQCDIRQDQETGIWFFDITDESETADKVQKSVKNASSRRRVPIHSRLLNLGFLAYVERVKRQGASLLFPEFSPSKGKASGEAEKWFRSHLEDLGLRDETPKARVVGYHAFRSTFAAKGKALREPYWGDITGHSNGLETAVQKGYSGDTPLKLKQEVLERFVFDFDLPVPVLV